LSVSPTDLDPELKDFCSRHHITPATREFHDDEDESGSDLCASNQSSDIEEESELKRFTQALQMAQINSLKKEKENKNKNKWMVYSKQSKRTQQHCTKNHNDLRAKGFLSVDEYMRRMEKPEKQDVSDPPTSELDNITKAIWEESEEASDEANALAQDTCGYWSVNSTSDVESEESLPLHNVRLHHKHLVHIESEESTGGDSGRGARDYTTESMSGDKTDNVETHTACEHFKVLRDEVLAHQKVSEKIPGSTSQVLGDRLKLLEVNVQLTKEEKRGDLGVIVWARVTAMISLLNIYTDQDLKYSWRKVSGVVAKTQGRGTNHARHICEWVMAFLKWSDLPFHQLKWKRSTIVDDEDVTEEIKLHMVETTIF
jgi:hypothetical protein